MQGRLCLTVMIQQQMTEDIFFSKVTAALRERPCRLLIESNLATKAISLPKQLITNALFDTPLAAQRGNCEDQLAKPSLLLTAFPSDQAFANNDQGSSPRNS